MVLSMTGFGRAIGEYGKKRFIVEIKSLNSKQLDLSVRMPSVYKEKEIELTITIPNGYFDGFAGEVTEFFKHLHDPIIVQ